MEGGPTFYNSFKHPLISHLSCCGHALITGFVEGCFHFSLLLRVFFLEWIIYGLKDNTNMHVCFVVTKAAPQMKTQTKMFLFS